MGNEGKNVITRGRTDAQPICYVRKGDDREEELVMECEDCKNKWPHICGRHWTSQCSQTFFKVLFLTELFSRLLLYCTIWQVEVNTYVGALVA